MAIRPAKVIQGVIQSTSVLATWDYDNGTGDPWVGVPYKFSIAINLLGQQQSSPAYGEQAFFYTGRDIKVGDWVFSSGGARVLLVVEVTDNVDPNNVVISVVDDDRVNVSNDYTQMGAAGIQEGDCFLFEAPGGIPALYPLPPNMPGPIPPHAAAEIMSRFSSLRKDRYIEVIHPGHTFAVGNAIMLGSDGIYRPAQLDAASVAIGIVADLRDTAHGPDKFVYAPVGPVIDLLLPGADLGQLVYIDSDGSYTSSPVGTYAQPAFVKLSATQAILLNTAAISDHFTQHVDPNVLFAASKTEFTWDVPTGNLVGRLLYRRTGATLRLMFTDTYVWNAVGQLTRKDVLRHTDSAVRRSAYTWNVDGTLNNVDRAII